MVTVADAFTYVAHPRWDPNRPDSPEALRPFRVQVTLTREEVRHAADTWLDALARETH